MTDEEGNILVSFLVRADRYAAKMAISEMKATPTRITVDCKPYKSRRSSDQNRLLWALLGKMAEALSGYSRRITTEECYCDMLMEANVAFDYLLAIPEAEPTLRQSFRVIEKIGERDVNGKTLNMYRCFIGSSKFDTTQMNQLIEATFDKLAELGISDSEIESMKGEYSEW